MNNILFNEFSSNPRPGIIIGHKYIQITTDEGETFEYLIGDVGKALISLMEDRENIPSPESDNEPVRFYAIIVDVYDRLGDGFVIVSNSMKVIDSHLRRHYPTTAVGESVLIVEWDKVSGGLTPYSHVWGGILDGYKGTMFPERVMVEILGKINTND
jgi:hypothetical protein